MFARFSRQRVGSVPNYRRIATQELAPYFEMNGKRTFIDGPQTLLEPDAAQAIAITLHELATNAAKYGALSTPNGQVRLEWSHATDGRLRLRWMETGGPVAQKPTRKGLGGRIIEQMIVQQKGSVCFDWREDGLVCEITIRVRGRAALDGDASGPSSGGEAGAI